MAKTVFMASAGDVPTEKCSTSPAIDIEDLRSTEASIGEGELKRTHTFWSCMLSYTFLLVIAHANTKANSVGLPDDNSFHLELQHYSLCYNIHSGRPSRFDVWNVSTIGFNFFEQIHYLCWLTMDVTASLLLSDKHWLWPRSLNIALCGQVLVVKHSTLRYA